MTKLAERQQEDLFRRVAEIIEAARGHVARAVNAAMVQASCPLAEIVGPIKRKARARRGDRFTPICGAPERALRRLQLSVHKWMSSST
jgi:hypothetical protein